MSGLKVCFKHAPMLDSCGHICVHAAPGRLHPALSVRGTAHACSGSCQLPAVNCQLSIASCQRGPLSTWPAPPEPCRLLPSSGLSCLTRQQPRQGRCWLDLALSLSISVSIWESFNHGSSSQNLPSKLVVSSLLVSFSFSLAFLSPATDPLQTHYRPITFHVHSSQCPTCCWTVSAVAPAGQS